MEKVKEILKSIGALILGGSIFIVTLIGVILLTPWFWLAVIAYILSTKL